MVFKSKSAPMKLSDLPIHEKIFEACRAHSTANKDSVIFLDAETTTKKKYYRDVEPTVNSLASALIKLGFKPGDVAAQAFPNCPEFLIAMLAVMKCGGAMSNASAIFTDYELKMQFCDSNSCIVFTDEDRLERIRRATSQCPGVRKIICLRTFPVRTEFPENVLDFVELTQTPDQPIDVKVSMDSIALLPYSSGTTGRPKGCLLTHRNIGAMLDIAKNHMEQELAPAMFGKGNTATWQKEHTVLLLPWYHAYGLNTMLETILLGMTGIVFKKFDTTVMLNRIKFYKVTLIFEKASNYEMKIIDKQQKEVTGTEKVGQLCFRGPTIMKGYLRQEEADIIDSDGFLKTGDLGSIDEKGRVHVTGRIKELIKVNGMQVPPVEIEDVLLLHSKVKDCAVIGMPDEHKGESPMAFVVKKDHTLTEVELTDFIRQKLSSYKWIDVYKFVDEIPKTQSGKIRRKKLRQMAEETESDSDEETSKSEKAQ